MTSKTDKAPAPRRERDGADDNNFPQMLPDDTKYQVALDKVRNDPACTFPYVMDTFQVHSAAVLEAGESVLVTAHTSAGKTTIAIYAIARALKQNKRVIYTSPIKALSNQKYKELSERFDDVGLMTGDTTIKPGAATLVMTTEILRSMLYRGTEMLREVGCVIFDEVHYMRDKSRGVVWEETIILLPEQCQCVFLSATIPNAHQFAGWFESIHPTAKCHVVQTNYRPVPLQHYLFPMGAQGIYLTIDEKGKFREDNFKEAMAKLHPNGASGGAGAAGVPAGFSADDAGKGGRGSKFARGKEQEQVKAGVMNIVQLVMERDMYPAIVFSFAKADCEKHALTLAKINFNTSEEEDMVQEVYTNAIESLSEDDRQLPAVEHLLPLLRRGVGIHHSGLLPILKEVVELLFGAGLVKCLFSTETFSMGLNMPARTVIFSGVTKWDGEARRILTGGEYIQMSGRAGRRGLDRVGIVIAMIDDKIEPDKLKETMSGGADTLNSSFHLTYNMVLNLLRVEDADPNFIMKRSFSQFQREGQRPEMEKQVGALRARLTGDPALQISTEHSEIIEEFENCQTQHAALTTQINRMCMAPRCTLSFICPGRVVQIIKNSPTVEVGRIPTSTDVTDFGFGICTGNYRCLLGVGMATKPDVLADPSQWTIDVAVLVYKKEVRISSNDAPVPCGIKEYASDVAELSVITFSMEDLAGVSTLKMNNMQNATAALQTEDGKQKIVQTLAAMSAQFESRGGIPKLGAKELAASAGAAKKKSADDAASPDAGGDDVYSKLEARKERIVKMMKDNELNVALEKLEQVQQRRQERSEAASGSDDDDDAQAVSASPSKQKYAGIDANSRALLLAHATYLERAKIEKEVATLLQKIENMSEAVLQDELKKMMRVMRRMDYVDHDNILMRKGRVACEITTSDENELLLTELLFRGTLNTMETEMIVALMSCLVNVSKQPDGFKLAEEFQWPLNELKEVVKRIATVSLESGLTISGSLVDSSSSANINKNNGTVVSGDGSGDPMTKIVADKVQPSLMEVTYRWAKGAKFIEVIPLTQAYEGDIVRMMRRLEELLRQMATAAKSPAIGSPELHDKFMAGITMIKRDIVFASSLYL